MSWKDFHCGEVQKEYYATMIKNVDDLYKAKTVYPSKEQIFRCFIECPLDIVRVVIIGQDPYHGPDQANGLAFAVNEDIKIPPSLRNILKESGSVDKTLLSWSKQGVFLLNTILTVEESKPLSCAKIGWETYTDNAIKYLVENSNGLLIFLLWGSPARSKKQMIMNCNSMSNGVSDENVIVLESSHPSPLSASSTDEPFIGSGQFKKVNEILKSKRLDEIQW